MWLTDLGDWAPKKFPWEINAEIITNYTKDKTPFNMQ